MSMFGNIPANETVEARQMRLRQEKCDNWRIALAKAYAKAAGYAGRPGAWIYYRGANKPTCQGWHAFYHKYKAYIWKWAGEHGERGAAPENSR